MITSSEKVKVRASTGADAAGVKCLACGYGNKSGESACSACGSSLDLRLCPACEAINASRAERCHACGTALHVAQPRTALALLRGNETRSSRPKRRLAALIALPLGVTVLLAYYVYEADLPFLQMPGPAAPPHAAPRPQTVQAPAVVAPPTQAAKQAQGKVSPATPPKAAAAAATTAAATAAAATTAAAPPVAAPSPARAVPAPAKVRVAAPPAPHAAREATASASEHPAATKAGSEPAAQKAFHLRVTHTKGVAKDAQLPQRTAPGMPHGSIQPAKAPETKANECSEAVVALGFCGANGGR